MKRTGMFLAIGTTLVLSWTGIALAASNPSGTGQPNQSCGSTTAPKTPGGAVSAPGSAFNPDGKAGTVYAGEQPQNSNNPKSVSQYDVACYQQPQLPRLIARVDGRAVPSELRASVPSWRQCCLFASWC
jgi:hypothetical protein